MTARSQTAPTVLFVALRRRKWSTSRQFVRQRAGIVDFPQSFDDSRAVDGDGAIGFFDVLEVTCQTFHISIEDEADKFAVPIDDRRARVPADNVQTGDEIERRRQIDSVLSLNKSRHEIERRLEIETCRAVV